MIFYVIAFVLLFLYSVIIFYYRWAWRRIKLFSPSRDANATDPITISVIIVARNEEQNIGACIESVLLQTFPAEFFEIVVVDDHSTDRTVEIIKSFKKNSITLIRLAEHTGNNPLNSYKKLGIKKAIEVAKGEFIVTTDADCILPGRWLETIAAFQNKTGSIFIAAPVVYQNTLRGEAAPGKLLKIFQSLDFTMLQGITAASVSQKFHSMCNGANLCYSKAVFKEVNGFDGIDNIASGDDMMLMHKIQKMYPENIGFLKSRQAIVSTQAAGTLKEFLNQRIRWASKADTYPDPKITGVLLLVYLLNLYLFICGVWAFFSLTAFYIFIVMLLVKTSVEMIFLFPVSRFFNNQELLWYFIPAQPFHIVYTIAAGWLGKFGSYNWKGRKVN